MKIESEVLIADLIERTKQVINQAQGLLEYHENRLNNRPTKGAWSALECLEHLNRYGDYYIPEIDRRIKTSKKSSDLNFRAGWLGNYFAKAMLPSKKMKKMNTFKDKNPIGSDLSKETIGRFIAQQHQVLKLLGQARYVSLTKTKTSISISTMVKLRLGDTFRIVIYHNERHMVQAKKALG